MTIKILIINFIEFLYQYFIYLLLCLNEYQHFVDLLIVDERKYILNHSEKFPVPF